MAKNLNVATTKAVSIATLSDYSVSTKALIAIREQYNKDKAPVEERIAKAKADRAKAIADGEERDVVVVKYDTFDDEQTLRAMADKFAEECKPLKKAIADCRKLVDDKVYVAYLNAYNNGGNVSATGTVTIGKDDKAKTYEVGKNDTLKAVIKSFLETLGIEGAEEDAKLDKFITWLVFAIGGVKLDNANGSIKANGKRDEKDKLIRATIQYLCEKRHFLTELEDGSLVKTSSLNNDAE